MMTQVWLSAAGLSLATVIGAIIGFGIKELPHKWNDAVLGFCAGVMLAAATLGLIVPAVEQAGAADWWLAVVGVAVGALFLNLLDFVTPHMHKITGLD
jgi:ZIP family zinc transporter